MNETNISPLPAIDQPRTARWVALGTAATVLLGGCSMISEAAEQPSVQKQIAELSIDITPDFTRNAACKPPDVAANSQVVAAAAKRCITFGMKDADLVIVDMTKADKKLKPFAKELANNVREATDGYITVKPRIVQPNNDTQTLVREITQADDCAPAEYENLLSTVTIQNTEGLAAVPYVVVVSDLESCSGDSLAISDGMNGNTILEFKDWDPGFSARAGVHEIGHVWGLGHDGENSKPINNTDWLYYSFNPEDMPDDVLDLETFLATDTTYTEYGILCRNMMGSNCHYDANLRLSAQQDNLLHWPDRALDRSYQNRLFSVRDEPVRLQPTLKEPPQALVNLKRIYSVANENGIYELDSMLIEALTVPNIKGGARIDGVLLSLTTKDGAQTAVVGVLDAKKAVFPNWALKVAPDQYVKIQIDKGGDLVVKQTATPDKLWD